MLNDDQLLDARDMAEEIAEAKGELTTCKHDGMRKPCIFGCDDERVLEDVDAVVEQVSVTPTRSGCWHVPAHSEAECPDWKNNEPCTVNPWIPLPARPRTFEDVINQWTEACLTENRSASDPAAILIVTRLGLLGQRLIYEANDLGMRQVMETTREVLKQ